MQRRLYMDEAQTALDIFCFAAYFKVIFILEVVSIFSGGFYQGGIHLTHQTVNKPPVSQCLDYLNYRNVLCQQLFLASGNHSWLLDSTIYITYNYGDCETRQWFPTDLNIILALDGSCSRSSHSHCRQSLFFLHRSRQPSGVVGSGSLDAPSNPTPFSTVKWQLKFFLWKTFQK